MTATIDKIGALEILDDLGTGANSRVLRVRRAADGREYALKVVTIGSDRDQKYLAQARQEYRVGRLLDHPNLVKVYCFETETGWWFRVRRARLLLEYVPGQTLDQGPPLKPSQLIPVFERVAAAVAHMHARGVVHADLKPNNILSGPAGVRVIDFGLARVRGDRVKRLQGTPEYMAPETAATKAVDERTDVFNLGATMYRLVTFRYPPAPPPGMTLGERSYRRLLTPVGELNPDAPPGLCDLIHRCLSYRAGDRPGSMRDVRAALARLARPAGA